MDNIHIENSYKIWKPRTMLIEIAGQCIHAGYNWDASILLHRPLWTMYVEWWLHNIGYYVTKPFNSLKKYNERFKHVDLNSW